MSLIIPIKNSPNHTIFIDLDAITYKLEFLYNSVANFWSMSIYDDDDNLLIAGVKIIPNYPLLTQYVNSSLPQGEIICEVSNTTEQITRDTFVKQEATLLYITESELAAF